MIEPPWCNRLKRCVARKQFVAAVAAERDGHRLAHEFAKHGHGQDRRVGKRLVQHAGYHRNPAQAFRGREMPDMMVRAVVLGNRQGIW